MQMMKFRQLPLAFMTTEPKYGGEYWKYLCLTIHKTQYLYKVWSMEGFMMNNDEILENAIVLTANEPNFKGK